MPLMTILPALRFPRPSFPGLLAALFCLAACGGGSPEDLADDPRLLGQALPQYLPGNGETFSVVYPETQLVLSDSSGTSLDSIADKIRNLSGESGYDARPMLDRLLKRNKRSNPNPLVSWPGAVFVVDAEGTYTKYLVSGNEGDWKRMYHDHPEVKSVVHVGLPAYDREKGLALVYVQEMTFNGAGNGSIHVLSWDGTTAEELGRMVVWSP